MSTEVNRGPGRHSSRINGMAIKVTVNGVARELQDGATGAALLETLAFAPGAVVAELNGAVVKRDVFIALELHDGDVLELVTVVGGG